MTNGIQIDMIGKERLEKMGKMEKIQTILDSVSEGKVVVLQEGLTPEEEQQLIESTMSRIEPDGFSGIEIETHGGKDKGNSGLVNRILNKGKKQMKMTFVGPSEKVESISKDEDFLSTLVSE